MTKQRWGDLSRGKQTAFVAIGTVQVGLSIAMLVDLRGRPADQINGSKRWWRLAAFVNTVGPVAYFAFGRKR